MAWAVQVLGDLRLGGLEGSWLAHLWGLDDTVGYHVGACAAADPGRQVGGLLLRGASYKEGLNADGFVVLVVVLQVIDMMGYLWRDILTPNIRSVIEMR